MKIIIQLAYALCGCLMINRSEAASRFMWTNDRRKLARMLPQGMGHLRHGLDLKKLALREKMLPLICS